MPPVLTAECVAGPAASRARGALAACALAACALTLAACASAPSPLAPAFHGSIGLPGRGVLAGGALVRKDAEGLRWLRGNDRHWAAPRFAAAIERAAAAVAGERAGSVLLVGDLSTRTGGGPLPPHFSHRSGMDADLLFYVTTLEGAPTPSPGFIHVGADGLARDDVHERWLRLDVEREWLLVKALVTDADARVQWVFVSNVVKAMLVEWALARGEGSEVVRRAQEVMLEPNPGGVHDDHIHVRTTCSPEEASAGCVATGPRRAWLSYALEPAPSEDVELVSALLDLGPPGATWAPQSVASSGRDSSL